MNSTLQEKIKTFGGKLVKGDTRCDGVDYMYRSVWDEAEDIEDFVQSFPDGRIKCATDIVDKYLTLWFSVSY